MRTDLRKNSSKKKEANKQKKNTEAGQKKIADTNHHLKKAKDKTTPLSYITNSSEKGQFSHSTTPDGIQLQATTPFCARDTRACLS